MSEETTVITIEKISAYTFDKAKVPSSADASLYNALNVSKNKVIYGRGKDVSANNLDITSSGLSVTVHAGQILICGRLVEMPSGGRSFSMPANATRYLNLKIDLGAQNTADGTPGQEGYTPHINQVSFVLTNSIKTNGDLFNGDNIYYLLLATLSSTSTTVAIEKNRYAYSSTFYNFTLPAQFNTGLTGMRFSNDQKNPVKYMIRNNIVTISGTMIINADTARFPIVDPNTGIIDLNSYAFTIPYEFGPPDDANGVVDGSPSKNKPIKLNKTILYTTGSGSSMAENVFNVMTMLQRRNNAAQTAPATYFYVYRHVTNAVAISGAGLNIYLRYDIS